MTQKRSIERRECDVLGDKDEEVVDYQKEIKHINKKNGMRVMKVLGRGTYGRVYAVRFEEREYALKLMGAESYRNDTVSISREIDSMRNLSHHDNIVTCFHIFHEKPLMMLFELAPYDLYKYMAETKPLPWRFIHAGCLQLLRAIEYAHSKNITHRDIKPSNILVYPSGRFVLADWGMARKLDGGEYTPQQCSLWYRSIEMLMDGVTTLKSDVWSIGCIFAEMSRGAPLFKSRTEIGMLTKIINVMGSLDSTNAGDLKTAFAYEYVVKGLAGRKPMEFKHSFNMIPSVGVKLLKSMLTLDPSSRLSASKCIEHELFSAVRDMDTERLLLYVNEKTVPPLSPAMPFVTPISKSQHARCPTLIQSSLPSPLALPTATDSIRYENNYPTKPVDVS